jgi:hypothetical protein
MSCEADLCEVDIEHWEMDFSQVSKLYGNHWEMVSAK